MSITDKQFKKMLVRAEGKVCDEDLAEVKGVYIGYGLEGVLKHEKILDWAYKYAQKVIQGRWLKDEAVVKTGVCDTFKTGEN